MSMREELDADVCVIGAGPAGLTLARELAQSGVDVRVLESGKWEPDETATSLAEGENAGYPYFALEKSRQRGVTGSTLRWTSHTRFRPLDPIDFEKRASVPNSGWPFSYDHLRPFYDRTHEILPLSSDEYSAAYWEDRSQMRLLRMSDGAFETTIFESIHGNAGNSSLVEIARKLGERIVTDTTVTRLVTNHDGSRVESVDTVRPDGSRSSFRARVFVLAAGGIDNPRLMLLSSNEQWRNGVGNHHDLVGRFFMEHPGVATSYIVPSEASLFDRLSLYLKPQTVDGTRILAAITVSEDAMRREGILNSSILLRSTDELRLSDEYRSMAALSLKGFRPGRWPMSRYGQDLGHLLTHPVRTASTLLGLINVRHPGRRGVLELGFTCEQAPNPDSRITLSAQRDAHGLPKARLEWRLTDLDIWSIRRTQDLLRDSLRADGLGDIEHLLGEERPPVRVFGQRHHMGTTRMHPDPKVGVVDENCLVHGLGNLYVTGSSVFPTGGYANPTLTIIAMALRMAPHLTSVLGRGVEV